MNNNNNTKVFGAIAILLFVTPFFACSQDSIKHVLLVNLSYFASDNKIDYLVINSKTKIAGKFQPVKAVNISIFLDKDDPANLIGKVTTNIEGLAKAILPPELKTAWESSAKHSFLAVPEARNDFETATTETEITKSKISIDTAREGDIKKVVVTVTSFNGKDWVPAPGVEMKIGIIRSSASILSAGDEATYTTDSSGVASAEYKKKNLPGDENGNIRLTAKIEDNEQFGNLQVEKVAPWGVAFKPDNNFFNQRTLWATRFRTPFWLLFIAYSIVIGVWGTIIYLILQIIKIKKLGTSTSH